MKIDTFPEFFTSNKIYSNVKDVMKKYARESDIELMVKELNTKGATSADVLKKLALISNRHMHVNKASSMILDIRESLGKLIRYSVEPSKPVMNKNGRLDIRIMVENLTGTLLKYKVGVKQLNRENTCFVYDPVANVTNISLVKSQVIEPGKAKAYKFIIKSDIFSIQDLYELKKEGKIVLMLGLQVVVDGVDGMRSSVEKIPIEISKIIN